jgi:hypothetical protein
VAEAERQMQTARYVVAATQQRWEEAEAETVSLEAQRTLRLQAGESAEPVGPTTQARVLGCGWPFQLRLAPPGSAWLSAG